MTTTQTAAALSTEHLTRMLFTEQGRAMLTAAQAEVYRNELFSRR